MHNMVKIASQELNSNNIVKNAFILRKLFNWIQSIFNKDKANEISRLMQSSDKIKNQMQELYKSIKIIEKAISNLDVEEYNSEFENLKLRTKRLNEELDKLDKNVENVGNLNLKDISTKTEPEKKSLEDKKEKKKEEEKIKETKKEEAPLTERGGHKAFPDWYDIEAGKTLSDYGITFKNLKKILSNKRYGIILTSPKIADFIKKYADETIKTNNKIITKNEINDLIYGKIPQMKITGLQRKDPNKPGLLSIIIESDYVSLPEPFQNFKIKSKFGLNDLRKNKDDPYEFSLLFQIFTILNTDNDIGISIAPTEEEKFIPGFTAPRE